MIFLTISCTHLFNFELSTTPIARCTYQYCLIIKVIFFHQVKQYCKVPTTTDSNWLADMLFLVAKCFILWYICILLRYISGNQWCYIWFIYALIAWSFRFGSFIKYHNQVIFYHKSPCLWVLWHWYSRGRLSICNPQGSTDSEDQCASTHTKWVFVFIPYLKTNSVTK